MNKNDIVKLKANNTMYSNKKGIIKAIEKNYIYVQFEDSKRIIKLKYNEVEKIE